MKRTPSHAAFLFWGSLILWCLACAWTAWNLHQERTWRKSLSRTQAIHQELKTLQNQKTQRLQAWLPTEETTTGVDAAVRARIGDWSQATVTYREPVFAADIRLLQAQVQWEAVAFPDVLQQLASLQRLPVRITSLTLEPQDETEARGHVSMTLAWIETP